MNKKRMKILQEFYDTVAKEPNLFGRVLLKDARRAFKKTRTKRKGTK